MKASEYFKKHVVNSIEYNWNPDGSVTISIYKQGWRRSYKFTVRNLYKPNEQVLEDEDVEE
jgi:hypothetical protein